MSEVLSDFNTQNTLSYRQYCRWMLKKRVFFFFFKFMSQNNWNVIFAIGICHSVVGKSQNLSSIVAREYCVDSLNTLFFLILSFCWFRITTRKHEQSRYLYNLETIKAKKKYSDYTRIAYKRAQKWRCFVFNDWNTRLYKWWKKKKCIVKRQRRESKHFRTSAKNTFANYFH